MTPTAADQHGALTRRTVRLCGTGSIMPNVDNRWQSDPLILLPFFLAGLLVLLGLLKDFPVFVLVLVLGVAGVILYRRRAVAKRRTL